VIAAAAPGRCRSVRGVEAQAPGNVLFITVDQWRGDCLGVLDHPVVRTPNLDRLAAEGITFARHYAQSAPCGPSRASLYTGQYLMNHRSVANGTPLDARFTNVALEARALGYDPLLFGYTDASPDPRVLAPDDPRLRTYEGVLPGFRAIVDLKEDLIPWGEWLRARGYDVPADVRTMYEPVSDAPDAPVAYRAEHTEAAYVTGAILDHLDHLDHLDRRGDEPWFVHAAYIRPHPPFVAPEPYNTMFDPATVPMPVRRASAAEEGAVHPLLPGAILVCEALDGPVDDDAVRFRRATYYGMMAEVDDQLGRLFDGLRARGVWDDTLVVLTSDHGEQLGDHWLSEKLGWFDQSFHVPLVVRDPRPAADATRGTVERERFTENVDVMPTLVGWMGGVAPAQCDGRSLLPLVHGDRSQPWRDAVLWEWDFSDPIGQGPEAALGIPSERCSLAVLRDAHGKYVHFAGLPPLFYDLDRDPGELEDRAGDSTCAPTVLAYAQRLLSRRMEHADRTLTALMVTPRGVLDGRRRRGSATPAPRDRAG
jgi:arylsulfatase A-like enzyme